MSVVLSEHLPLLATAPDGIQKLRGLILELAVRGKLVPQDPKDAPASELLKRIAHERTRLKAERGSKTFKASPLVGEAERPFEIPEGWEWIRLTHLGEFLGGKTPSTNRSEYWDGSIPWVSPKDMKSLVVSQTEDYVTDLAILDGLTVIPASSVLIVVRSGILRRTVPVAVNSLQCTVNQDLKALCLVLPDMALYAQLLIRGFERQILDTLTKVGTTVESIKFEEFSQQPFPLPPLAEQHRIIAKVDELMALCDRLEAEQADAEAAHAKLVETLLGTLTRSTDAADFAANWQRLAGHFDTLFITESSLDALKQTILQLAVMGKLVPQDPADEPASELLKRIAQQRARLQAEGSCKRSKPVPLVGEDVPFELPNGWSWARFAQIATVNGRLVDSQDCLDAMQVAPDSIERGTGRLIERRTVREAGVRGPNQRFQAGQLLYSKIRPSLSKAVIVDFEGLCSADMYPLDPYIEPRFLLNQILSEVFLQQVRAAENRVKMPKLNQESLNAFLVCIPPLAEQRRIVAKVGELTALCDRLKADLAEARSRQARLATTLIESALKAA